MCHFFSSSSFLQSGGTSQWRVCYQRGLPRLVFKRPGVAWAVLQTPLYLIQGCHSEPKLIRDGLGKHQFCVVLA